LVIKRYGINRAQFPLLLKSDRIRKHLFTLLKQFHYSSEFALAESTTNESNKICTYSHGDIGMNFQDFMQQFGNESENILYTLWRCLYETKPVGYATDKCFGLDIKEKINLINSLLSNIKLGKDKKCQENAFLLESIKLYHTHLEICSDEDFIAEPILTFYMKNLSKSQYPDMDKTYKIRERMSFIAKIRVYCNDQSKENLEKLDKLIKEKNNTGKLISFFDLAEVCCENRLLEEAEKYALKIRNFEEKIYMLKYLQTPTSLKAALDMAVESKRLELVLDIEGLIFRLKTEGKVIYEEKTCITLKTSC